MDIDFSDWTMQSLLAWLEAGKAPLLNTDTLNDLMSRCIKRWDYAGDPSVVGSYNYLSIPQWFMAYAAVTMAVIRYIERSIPTELQP